MEVEIIRHPLPVYLLRETLEADFEHGRIFWKPRGLHWFGGARPDVDCRRWNAYYPGLEAFTHKNTRGYHVGQIRYAACGAYNYRRARVIFALKHGKYPTPTVDHIDRKRDNDAICNLREADVKLQIQNRNPRARRRDPPIKPVSEPKVVGVRWHERDRRWQASISFLGDDVHLGQFSNRTEAIASRKAAEKVVRKLADASPEKLKRLLAK